MFPEHKLVSASALPYLASTKLLDQKTDDSPNNYSGGRRSATAQADRACAPGTGLRCAHRRDRARNVDRTSDSGRPHRPGHHAAQARTASVCAARSGAKTIYRSSSSARGEVKRIGCSGWSWVLTISCPSPSARAKLVARVRAVLRRRSGNGIETEKGRNEARFDGWSLSYARRELRSPGVLSWISRVQSSICSVPSLASPSA